MAADRGHGVKQQLEVKSFSLLGEDALPILDTKLDEVAQSLGPELEYWTLNYEELKQIFVDIWFDGL